jgi:hypothetical protein
VVSLGRHLVDVEAEIELGSRQRRQMRIQRFNQRLHLVLKRAFNGD